MEFNLVLMMSPPPVTGTPESLELRTGEWPAVDPINDDDDALQMVVVTMGCRRQLAARVHHAAEMKPSIR